MDKALAPQDPRSDGELMVAFDCADHIVTKKYIQQLTLLPIVPLCLPSVEDVAEVEDGFKKITRFEKPSDRARFFKLEKLVYDGQENNIQKLTNVYSAIASTGLNVALLIDSDGTHVDVYMGVYGQDRNLLQPQAEALNNYLIGNFQGTHARIVDNIANIDTLVNKCFADERSVIAAVSGVASIRSAELESNAQFNQGIEKMLDTMRGEPFSALFLADSISPRELEDIKAEYELLYSALAPFSKSVLTLNDSQSEGVSKTLSESLADTVGTNTSSALSVGTSKSTAHTEGHTTTHTDSGSVGKTFGIPFLGPNLSYSHSASRSKSYSDTTTFGTSETSTKTIGDSKAHTVTKTTADGTTETYTLGKSLQLTYENKSIQNLLNRIDGQLERIKNSESFGMFATCAYFTAGKRLLAETAASAYKSIISGTNTALEVASTNVWDNPDDVGELRTYLKSMRHPHFSLDQKNSVTPASLVSAQELSIQMGLPKHSVPGLSVVETAAFGRSVYRADGESLHALSLGHIYHMGQEESLSNVTLDKDSLAMHTFVTGSTGSGKSNTVYELIRQLPRVKVNFMIIEPAKGEYKNVFGTHPDVRVFGTNPKYSELLKINPFRFPKEIHILEHVDRLIEIFNVCWPMYAAMPAVLKDAVLQTYQVCGWDLANSTNSISPSLFPTFQDLQTELVNVINSSAYSQEVKSNYIGSLATRIKSLANGLNGQIFSSNEIDNATLFDKNVIVDLSRVGASETKALIMGILIMRLNEHRISTATGMNVPLKHITVLEEAHNILKRTSGEQNPESSNVAGKSVEMISNAIAEMRTYGEGFIIADQSPNAVDLSAIRNTNTKIIMRLPDEADRNLAGRSAALKEAQLDEIAKLPKGVAVVYQNDWLEPVLCKINEFKGPKTLYKYSSPHSASKSVDVRFKTEALKLLLKDRLSHPEAIEIDVELLSSTLFFGNISVRSKIALKHLVHEYQITGTLRLWHDENFHALSHLVVELLDCKDAAFNLLRNFVDNATTLKALDFSLQQLIEQQTTPISNDLRLAITQCILKDCSVDNPHNTEIYAKWRERMVRGIVI